jgi:hypothetical protein
MANRSCNLIKAKNGLNIKNNRKGEIAMLITSEQVAKVCRIASFLDQKSFKSLPDIFFEIERDFGSMTASMIIISYLRCEAGALKTYSTKSSVFSTVLDWLNTNKIPVVGKLHIQTAAGHIEEEGFKCLPGLIEKGFSEELVITLFVAPFRYVIMTKENFSSNSLICGEVISALMEARSLTDALINLNGP